MGDHLIMQDIQNKFLFFPIFSGKFLFFFLFFRGTNSYFAIFLTIPIT